MIIGAAYGTAEFQILGPSWLKHERFDIVGRADRRLARQDELLPLLGERFHLAVHPETRQLSAYALSVAKGGPKLEPADSDGGAVPFQKASKSGGNRIHSPHLSMPQLADMLSHRLGHPVRDMTGLTSAYRVTLEWASDQQKPEKPAKAGKLQRAVDRPTIFTALQEQLGLRLETRKAPVELLVIDHIEKTPVAN